MAELNYKKDMYIDPDALDLEWLRQPELGRKYARNAASKRREARLAEERVKVIKSELIRKCNENPKSTTGKDKPNAIDIEAYYRTHPTHKDAKQEWIEAEFEADIAELAQKEISYGRKAALEGLVTLHAAQYFAGPKVPRDLNKEWEQKIKQDKVDDVIQSKMKRSK